LRLPEALQKFQKAQSMNETERTKSRIQIESNQSLFIAVILFPLSGFRGGVGLITSRAESVLYPIKDEIP
jgi:uncharacterized protein YbaR (Trm112 family)